ncbi:Thrombospondin type 3 repeat-containing protein [Chryseobacterium shigense]|uniref:Thrombospondin type 3 repeat-containing protein n=1 Tax=Chryseobacterium shigense TaxID=297244 RepID=A0A1N7IGJ8_9FLAO|nr:Thrombospondin type 3 repeat-containing protein [Chryseobacterium shigense]
MKIKVSAVLFFIISCFHAQEIKDKDAFEKCRKENSRRTCLSDKDKDGVLFYADACPYILGLAEYKGCPDTDGDGVPDKEDQCYEVAGSLENNGCPWPDTDGDGVINKNDACPNVFGPAENNGCPWPDTDGDGILDKDDPCPTQPGKVDGCRNDNCAQIYKEEDERIENFKKETKNVDYEKLTTSIIDHIDKTFYKDKDLVILTHHMLGIEGGSCIGKNPAPIYNYRSFWTIDTIKRLSALLKKNIALSSAYQSFSSPDISIEYNADYNLKNVSKFVYKREIKHLETLQKRLGEHPVDNYGMLMTRFTNELGNMVKVQYTYTNLQAGKPVSKKEINVTYQYINNEWKVTETKEEKVKVFQD